MADINWAEPIHYNDGEYPCMIVKAYDQSEATHPGDLALDVILTTPKGRWLSPMLVTWHLVTEANWMPHVYSMAVRHYERRTETTE